MNQKKKKTALMIFGGILLYLTSAGLSYGAFRYLSGSIGPGLISPVAVEEARSRIDPSAPKTEACPLNGQLYSKAEREIWEGRRPLAIMVENHEEARPQSGLSRADIIYEAVAEGGITRFLAVYFCGASAADITVGPVRSARTYYLDWASEYGDYPLYAHVGGANVPGPTDALGQINQYGWGLYNDLNQFSLTFPVFWRDPDRMGRTVATEHSVYASTDKLWDVAKERGLTQVDDQGDHWDENYRPWQFKKEADTGDRGDVDQIGVEFWNDYGQYGVTWRYDIQGNVYYRSNGGQAHLDLNDDSQLKAKSVVIQYTQEKGPLNAEKHMLYTTIGSGKALVFQDGQAVRATWSKADRESRTVFKSSQGEEIEFNPGQIWVQVVPVGQEVDY
jgi:hypothetical protein